MAGKVQDRIGALGIEPAQSSKPDANYVPNVRIADLLDWAARVAGSTTITA